MEGGQQENGGRGNRRMVEKRRIRDTKGKGGWKRIRII